MKTAIVSTTKYTSGGESDRLRTSFVCDMLQKAKTAGITMLVLDGSLPELHKQLKSAGGNHVIASPPLEMGPGRRLIFHHALEHLYVSQGEADGVIIWTEEKPGLMRYIKQLSEPIINGGYDAVIPARLEENWGTYPPWQAESEWEYNRYYGEVTGRIGYDPALGPVAFRAGVLRKLLYWNPAKHGVSDTYLNHWLPLLIADKRVLSLPIDIPYPAAQRAVEEKNKEVFLAKRIWQRNTYIKAYKILAELPKLA